MLTPKAYSTDNDILGTAREHALTWATSDYTGGHSSSLPVNQTQVHLDTAPFTGHLVQENIIKLECLLLCGFQNPFMSIP